MSRIEDLLREAARESGARVESGSLPRLDLSQSPYDSRKRAFRVGTGHGGGLARRGIARPVLAAAMVVAVVALSLTLPGVLRGRSAGDSGPASAGQGTGPSGVPRYYVTGSGPQSSKGPVSAEVVDSRTGAAVALVKPPPGVASFVQFGNGSSDDRSFVVAAVPKPAGGPAASRLSQPLTLFVLRFDPATRQATLQQLPPLKARIMGRDNVTALAMSPDGARLAVSAVGPAPGSPIGSETFQVSVITLSPGSAWRTWQSTFSGDGSSVSPFIWATQPQYGSAEVAALSWTPGSRVLALGIPQEAVLLDTTRDAGDLLTVGRQVVFAIRLAVSRAKGNAFQCDSPATLSGDGTALVCFGQLEEGVYPDLTAPIPVQKAGANAIGRFSVATGKLLSLTVLPGSYKDTASGGPGLGGVAWSNPAGDVLVTGRTNGQRELPGDNKLRTIMIVVSHGVTKTIPEPAWAAASPDIMAFDRGVGW
jgi:hypothetical protein